MKENTNLVTKTPEELSPEQEKEILSLIKAEASSFVPDKLLSVLKACGIESEVSEEDEAFVLGMLKGNSFVPDDKAALEKTTGIVTPDLKKDEKALTRRMRREASAFVPNKKHEIYSKTGLKEHFSFSRFMKKNWAFVGAGAAAIAGLSIGANAYLNNREIVNAASSYINVSITPSTCDVQAPMRGYEGTSEAQANNYKPSWGMSADNKNLVTDVKANNYSANLVAVRSDNLLEKSAYQAVADLINPCYEKGYLEAVDKASLNTITIDIVSTIDNYADVYEDSFKQALNSALQKDRVYANVEFNVFKIDTLVRSDHLKMSKISKIYSTFNREVDPSIIANCNEETISNLESAIDSTALARLSELGLKHLTEGIKETFLSFIGAKQITSSISESEFKQMREELASHSWFLRQYFGTEDVDKLYDSFNDDSGAIYISDLNKFMMDENPMLKDLYKEVRNYILAKATETEEDFSNYLLSVSKYAESAQKSTGYFPDAGKADPGIWSHGDGWCEPGWGPGGWGGWWRP